MPDKNIFCNVPWTNTHIYWDGTFGMCCSESQRLQNQYSIKNTTVIEWFNQRPLVEKRQEILASKPLPNCSRCYHEESHGHESRRIKENYKSVIFTEQAFDRSFYQSPMRDQFTPTAVGRAVDWHVDLGNECNLACKMCYPQASSRISSFYQRWQLIDQSANSNWTQDPEAWQNFLTSIDQTPDLNRIHFMGGEPLLNKKFLELLEHLVDINRTNISLSFVTNGTLFNSRIVELLAKFRSADIEVSIESLGDNNHYIRQGSNTQEVLANIQRLIDCQSSNLHVILRTVPQLLSVNNYYQLIEFALEHRLAIQSIPLSDPSYLQISVLPQSLRQSLLGPYRLLRDRLEQLVPNHSVITTGRNVAQIELMLLRETDTIINMLSAPEADPALRTELTNWLIKWDREFGLDARLVYPEYREFFIENGYSL